MMTFGPIIETLLAGEFICSQRFPEYHRQLQDETLQNQINDYLRPLNRTVSQAADGSVYSDPCYTDAVTRMAHSDTRSARPR
jgi:hypothetical protein